MREKKKPETFRRMSEWVIVKRERKTGKVIKTVSLDADIEIPEDVSNFSEYIRDLMKRDKEARAKANATRKQEEAKPETEEPLTEMEENLYGWMDNWNKICGFHKLGMQKYGSHYIYLKLEPNADEMFSLLSAVKDNVEKARIMNPEYTEYFNEILAYIQSLRNRELWNNVYHKFCKHWREEHPQPEAYRKEVLRFERKSWTGAEVLEKVLPHIDWHAVGTAEKGHQTTTKKIAEIFHVNYQVAYNKIVPHISSILKDAGVEIV